MKKISVRSLLLITVIGFMANNVLPLRTGEVVRSFVLNRNHGVRKSAALSTIAVERIFDGITMLAFMLIAATTIHLTSDLRHVVKLASVLFAVAIWAGRCDVYRGSPCEIAAFGLRFVPAQIGHEIEGLAEAFFLGTGLTSITRVIAAVALSSIAAWSLEASMYGSLPRRLAVRVQDIMGFSETLLTTGVANLATLVPSSPGYVGPFEAGIKTALEGALDISGSAALSYAILVHACLWFPVTLWGAISGRGCICRWRRSPKASGTASYGCTNVQ